MDFNEIVESIRTFKGVTRKRSIADVREKLKDVYNVSGNVYLAFGDDAAAVDIGNNQLMLLATDGIWGALMDVNPWWAGYCSVLVNVNDIAAMGGRPMGMTNVLSSSNPEITAQIMDGIKEGVKKFGVPMVGGHTHPDTPYDALDVAISGIVDKDAVIPSCGAVNDDNVIVAIDLDGDVYPGTEINWDTTSDKSPSYVQNQINVMETIEAVGLKERKDNFPAQLSGGEQQRVAIARALAKNPKLLLCDEPTGALDYNTGKAVLKLLQDTCRKYKMTVVVITHNLALTPMGDKVIKVKNGKVSSVTINENPTPVERIEW